MNHMTTVHNMGEKEFKCEQCPYASAFIGSLKRHIDGVHEKIRRHVCEECGHGASTKNNLMYHMKSVHNIGGLNQGFLNVKSVHMHQLLKGI